MGVYSRELPAQKDGQRARVWTASLGSGDTRQRRDFRTKKEAEAWHAKNLAEINSGEASALISRITLGELWKEYLAHMKKRNERDEGVCESYIVTISSHMRNYILCQERSVQPGGSRVRDFNKGLQGIRVSDLTTGRVTRFVDDLRDAGCSVSSARAIMRSLSGMLSFAVVRDYTRYNAALRVKVRTAHGEASKKVYPPSPTLVSALLKVLPLRDKLFCTLLLATGLRVSEAIALRWHHFDYNEQLVRVRTKVEQRTMKEGRTKSLAGVRDIPISPDLLESLRSWRKITPTPADQDLVFPNKSGGYRNQKNDRVRLQARIAKIIPTLPLKDQPKSSVGFHTFRHYAISTWIAEKLPLKAVSTFAGHSTIQITVDRYGHLFPSEDHGVAMRAVTARLMRGEEQ